MTCWKLRKDYKKQALENSKNYNSGKNYETPSFMISYLGQFKDQNQFLGPSQNAICVAPICETEPLSSFADVINEN